MGSDEMKWMGPWLREIRAESIDAEIARRMSHLYLTFCYPVYRIAADGSVDVVRRKWVSEDAEQLHDRYGRFLTELRKGRMRREHEKQAGAEAIGGDVGSGIAAGGPCRIAGDEEGTGGEAGVGKHAEGEPGHPGLPVGL